MSGLVAEDGNLQLPDWVVKLFQPILAWQPMIIVMAVASFLIAWNRGIALLYGLFVLLVATLIISYVMPRLKLRGISVQRNLPTEFFAGKQSVIEYRINTSGHSYQLTLLDYLPFKADPDTPLRSFAVEVDRHQVIQQSVICEKRGKHIVEHIDVACAYPFGVVKVRRRIATERTEILVLPKLFEIAHLPFLSAQYLAADGLAVSQRQGTMSEFSGIREYQRGDSLKYIHWPATAKYQMPIVREYDSQDKPRLLIVLDCSQGSNVGQGSHSTFEYAIQIAASMLTHASQKGYVTQLVTSNHETQEIEVPAYSHDLIPYYEALALMVTDSDSRYPATVEYAQQRYPKSNIVVTFRNQSAKTRPFVRPGVTHIDIEMLDRSFVTEIPQEPASSRQGEQVIYSVGYGVDLEKLFYEG